MASVPIKSYRMTSSMLGEDSKPHMTRLALASALHTSVAGLVGVASLIILASKRNGLIGTLSCLTCPPRQKKISEEDYLVPGLQNHGHNCYFNVILQALASCSHFKPHLVELMEESERSAIQGISLDLSLADALDEMLRGLQMLRHPKEVLDPIKVMKEITHHVPDFNFTFQQDAFDALCHIINSIRTESLKCYVPNRSPIAVPAVSEGRIRSPQMANDLQSIHRRWQKHFFGPLDGITGSILTCQSCSSQLSLTFEFFDILILTPVPTYGSVIMRGCTLVDCLREFTVGHRENWQHCPHCWHAAAAKYLSSERKNVGEIDKVEACTRGDSCECKSLSGLREFQWSDSRSRIVRRTRIARSPEILCIELHRAKMVGHGDPFKLEGHVAFPPVLDLSPFTLSGFGMRGDFRGWHQRVLVYYPIHDSMLDRTQIGGCSSVTKTDSCSGADDKIVGGSHTYRLVSVIEHLGPMENGHFTAYRSLRTEPGHTRWFRVSDTDVQHASEADVLAAEAYMLFYERIPEGES